MIAEELNSSLQNIGACGHTLNIEERAALQTSLLVLKRNCKFKRVHFWGKVFGLNRDYLVAQGFGANYFGSKKSFTSHDGVEWVQLPELTPDISQLCDQIKGRFSGDPSTESIIELSSDSKKSVSITEEKRLARLIQLIDQEAAVVPRGAFVLTARHHVTANSTFQGLNYSEVDKLHNYCHFRGPEKLHKKYSLQREGLSQSLDFMDTIEEDIPNGCWSFATDKVSNAVTIKSLLWPGFHCFHTASTPSFGYVYFGFGDKNVNIGFML